MRLPDPFPINPIEAPLAVAVSLPGSKSITNRALVCAALAGGRSVLHDALGSDDTEAMIDGLRALGARVAPHWSSARIEVEGMAGYPTGDPVVIDARLSGTTARFLLPVAGLGAGLRRIDASNPMRARPMAEAIAAVRDLGANVRELAAPGHLPVEVDGGTLSGGETTVAGTTSSQFLSGLLLAAPAMPAGLTVHVEGDLVSAPYVDLTQAVLQHFGVVVGRPDAHTWTVAPQDLSATTYRIEPDASTASYAFGAAALLGGTVTVEGLGRVALQGDLAFVDLLAQMGAAVEQDDTSTTVTGPDRLHGIEADMSQISDTAQTLAVLAAFADSPTRVSGIGFIRSKETDRIAALCAELRRLGIDAREEPDGFTVRPGAVRPATVRTYGDHRMAMAFALVGLRTPGVQIADPGCVVKTFPGYWQLLEELRDPGRAGTMVHHS